MCVCVCVWDPWNSTVRRPRLKLGCCAKKKRNYKGWFILTPSETWSVLRYLSLEIKRKRHFGISFILLNLCIDPLYHVSKHKSKSWHFFTSEGTWVVISNFTVDRDSSAGIATCYRLTGPGIEKPISVAERWKSRVCGRSLDGIAGSNPAGGMNVCVVSTDNKAKCRTINTKKQVPMKYEQSTREW